MKNKNWYFTSIIVFCFLALSIGINIYYLNNKMKCKNPIIVESKEVLNLYMVPSYHTKKLLRTYEENANEMRNIIANAYLALEGMFEMDVPDFTMAISMTEDIALWLREDHISFMYSSDVSKLYAIQDKDVKDFHNYLDIESLKTSCKITKTYQVLSVNSSTVESEIYITIREFQSEELTTVRVLKSYADFKVKKNYEFYFEQEYQVNLCSTAEIFSFAKLNKVMLTNKTGLDQIQEDNCNF